jgi:hypothetical protein
MLPRATIPSAPLEVSPRVYFTCADWRTNFETGSRHSQGAKGAHPEGFTNDMRHTYSGINFIDSTRLAIHRSLHIHQHQVDARCDKASVGCAMGSTSSLSI